MLAALTCDVGVHASSLHSLLVLSVIVSRLGTEITFYIQYTNLLLRSLDRYTPMVFPTDEMRHVGTSSLLSSDFFGICHTEKEGCEKS